MSNSFNSPKGERYCYSRQNPGPRYWELIEEYRKMHEEKHFSGIGVFKWRKEIRKLVHETGARTILDYGSGRAASLDPTRTPKALLAKLGIFCESWEEAIGVESVTPYDPASPEHCVAPTGQFDGVYCIDVLEHIDEHDIPWVLEEIFDYAKKFVFLTIATIPAKKDLPNGENAHVTIRDQDWWNERIAAIGKPHVRRFIVFESDDFNSEVHRQEV